MSEGNSGYSEFWYNLLSHTLTFALTIGATVVAANILVKSFEGPQDTTGGPNNERLQQARAEWVRKYGSEASFPELTQFELAIMQDMIFPSQINSSFEDIGGLDDTKRELYETVLLPLIHPHLYSSMSNFDPMASTSSHNSSIVSPIHSLLSAPTGVLFYGPPGCGKTLVAKAIAQSADCTFIQCNFATLISKYYGESEKFINSLFSLARKFAPSVIFIDEVDMYLGKRGQNDRDQENRMKAQFLSLWDGLTSSNGQVLVLGATNRPFDLDEAILRRFSKQILFNLPTTEERYHILNVLLTNHVALEDDVLQYVAERTHGFSGSDLKALCKRAAMEAVREHIYKHHEKRLSLAKSQATVLAPPGTTAARVAEQQKQQIDDIGRPRKTTCADFDIALKDVQPTGQASMDYLRRFYNASGAPQRFGQNPPPSSTTPGQKPPPLAPHVTFTLNPSQSLQPAAGKKRGTKKAQNSLSQSVGSTDSPVKKPSKPQSGALDDSYASDSEEFEDFH